MTDEQLNEPDQVVDEAADDFANDTTPPQYGAGPFSIREVAIASVWLVAFVISFFPVTATITGSFAQVTFTWSSVWLAGLSWVLTIGVPTVAVFLLILRRLSPDGIRRFGSLGVDQFASVAFTVSSLVWLGWVWETVGVALQTGSWVRSWVIWVELILMLAGVVLTAFAPFIPPFSEDFAYRQEVVAHRNARPTRPISPRPARQPAAPAEEAGSEFAPASAEPSFGYGVDGAIAPTAEASAHEVAEPDEYGLAGDQADWKPAHTRDTFATAAFAEREPEPETQAAPVRHQAFWALAPEERDVVDDAGVPIFRVGPTAWALVIEDRVDYFVVRHEDGRVGRLHDISDVTRG